MESVVTHTIPELKKGIVKSKNDAIFEANEMIKKSKNLIFHNFDDQNSKDEDGKILKNVIKNKN